MGMNISLVIPVFNEENRINLAFEALKGLRLPQGLKLHEVIFVNDGSTDSTLKLLKNYKLISKLPIKLLSYKLNKGKGYAVKRGMLLSSGSYTLLIDADMSTPFSEIKKLIPFMNIGADIVIGTRKNGKSTVTIHQPIVREVLGKSFTRLTQFALQMHVTDFTCGFKLFSQKATTDIFAQSKINRWGYDAEILFIANKNGFSIFECPVKWADVKNSHVNLVGAVINTFVEIAKIRLYHTSINVSNVVNLSVVNNIFPRINPGVFLERKMFFLLNSSPFLKERSFLEVFNKISARMSSFL